ncbi:hypothetical protein Tco_0971161 [Tanacetum coccineum]
MLFGLALCDKGLDGEKWEKHSSLCMLAMKAWLCLGRYGGTQKNLKGRCNISTRAAIRVVQRVVDDCVNGEGSRVSVKLVMARRRTCMAHRRINRLLTCKSKMSIVSLHTFCSCFADATSYSFYIPADIHPNWQESLGSELAQQYGKPNLNWRNSLFDIIADGVYTTFFDQPEHAKEVQDVAKTVVQDVAKTYVQDVAHTTIVEADQVKGTHQNHKEGCLYVVECQPDEAQDPFCFVPNMRMELCLGTKQDGCLGNVIKYEDEKDKEEDETDETDDEEEELWTPKSKGKALSTPRIPQTTKKFIVKSTIRRRSRFQREPKNNITPSNNSQPRKNLLGAVSNSLAAVLKSRTINPNIATKSSPAIVLDDSCIMERDFSCCLMGKIKDINALSNLYIILANEGFERVKLSYLGGHWVCLEIDSRLMWVSIKGLPVKALTRNTFAKIISSWGELVNIDESENFSLSCIRVCVKTKPNVLINDKVKIIIKGQLHWICVKELEAWMPEFNTETEDDTSSEEESEGNNENDLGIYKLLKRNKDTSGIEGDTPQYPPGFTSVVKENFIGNNPGNTS